MRTRSASYRGRIAELDAAGLAELMHELAAIGELVGRAGSYAGLRFAVDTADPATGALMARVEERGTAINNELLFFELEWAEVARRARRRAARRRAARVLPPLPRVRAPLPPAPADRAGGAHPRREGGHRDSAWVRLFSELTSAITVDLDGAHGEPRAGPVAAEVARPRRAPHRRRGGHRRARARACARARSCSTRCSPTRRPTTGCAATRQLDREPQPRQRGERRVGAGARRRGAGALRHPAALVRAEGAAARPRPHRRLRPHGVGGVAPTRSSAGTRRASSCSTRTRRSRPSWRRPPSGSSTSRGSTRRCGPGKRPGRVLRVHRAVAPPVPAAQLDRAPARRAHARARARPRPARVPRARAGRLPPDHAAHAGRDRVGVRRDGHVRPAARRDRRSRRRGSRCSPRASRARSRPCSARSR